MNTLMGERVQIMFLYKNQKFHARGICFALPDNFYLHSSNETGHDRCMEIEAPDHSYMVTIGIDELYTGTDEELETIISDGTDMNPLNAITPITIAGYSGHCLKYLSTREQYFEIRLSIRDDSQFYLYVTDKTRRIDETIKSPEIEWILQHIKHSDVVTDI